MNIIALLEVFVVVVENVRSEVQAALENTDLKTEIEWICVPTGEDWGTADSLRHIGEKIMVCQFIAIFSV